MFVHPNIDPVAVHLGPLQIHWYGLMYLAAFVCGYLVYHRQAKLGLSPIKPELVEDALFYTAMGVVLGGRIGYVLFYGYANLIDDPLWAFKVWQGGMSFHGGFLGVLFSAYLFSRKYKISLGAYLDVLALAVPIGIAFGRLGNFIGQELWGRPTTVPWAVIFPRDPSGLPRHPSQLYELVLEGIVLFIIMYAYTRKPRPAWSAGALFIFFYGMFRFLIEFVREPDVQIGFDLFNEFSRGQLLSLPMIIGGIILWFWSIRQPAKTIVSK